MVAIDYFTKWVEVEVLVSITPAKINEFVYKNIIYQYGVPHTIVADNRTQFDCHKFKEVCDDLQIKKVFSSVTRPQANGQVEAVNKMIKHNLNTKLKNLKERWTDDLPKVLWAYKTTTISIIGEMPFSLAYEYEAMVPVELGTRSSWRDNFDAEQNMILQRCDSQLRAATYQWCITRYFNSKVKMR